MALTAADLTGVTWAQSVERFVGACDWLTDADLPQLKALYAIAQTLDSGRVQAALISQFTLTQRTLMGKRPGGATATDDAALDMFIDGTWQPDPVAS